MFIFILKSITVLDYHGYKQNCGTNSGLIQWCDIIKDNNRKQKQTNKQKMRHNYTSRHLFKIKSQLSL